MALPDLKDIQRFYVVVCFVQEDDLDDQRLALESLGNQKNVKLVVQPCPYEGIEFLFRIEDDLLGHETVFDEAVLWKILALKKETPGDVMQAIADNYHAYFCALLDQDNTAVAQLTLKLKDCEEHFVDSE